MQTGTVSVFSLIKATGPFQQRGLTPPRAAPLAGYGTAPCRIPPARAICMASGPCVFRAGRLLPLVFRADRLLPRVKRGRAA